MGVKRGLDSAGMSAKKDAISEDEAALYDRQIRLWGLESQKRIRAGRILVLGLNGLGAEVVKNLALSGVKKIVIMDNSSVKNNDRTAQFFTAGSEIGKNRAEASKAAIQELNPNVEIVINEEEFASNPQSFLENIDIVCACDCSSDLIFKTNKVCRDLKKPFFCGSTFGFHGYCFVDLPTFTVKRQYEEAKEMKTDSEFCRVSGPPQVVKKTNRYCLLETAFNLKVDAGLKKRVNPIFLLAQIYFRFRQLHRRSPCPSTREADFSELQRLRAEVTEAVRCDEERVGDDILCSSFGEISPICAVVGGIYANEIIKSLSDLHCLMHNFFLFNGDDCNGVVEAIIPPELTEIYHANVVS